VRALFIGKGKARTAWYRCYLPAIYMGADWSGLEGTPPNEVHVTGQVGDNTQRPNMFDYDVVVIQQPANEQWLDHIKKLRAADVKVLVEIDDYVHGIPKKKDHDFREHFTPEYLRGMERCMRAADGLIVSTDYLAKRYRQFNDQVWVCHNSLDVARYRLTRPSRPTVNIGWAGATAHAEAVMPWLQAVANVMFRCENTCFVSIGQPFAEPFKEHFADRAISIPFTMLETYPAAMTMFDIALAPAGRGLFYRGKSDLRWLEAGALGIPVIGSPKVYPLIEHGVTGFHASSAEEVEDLLLDLVRDEEKRTRVGESVKRYVLEERSMERGVEQWQRALGEVVGRS
jgi:glycosyltransferase involved in cell wall biosynthesis